jgi:two-component system, cell cycle sensor histidine kinase and response regulator CckA
VSAVAAEEGGNNMVFTDRIRPRDANPITILVVEDEAPVRMLMKHILEQAGYDVSLASDGLEGLQWIANHPRIDLVVTDLSMPGMNGVDFARHASSSRPELKFLFVSGVFGDFPDRDQSVPCLVKPFTVEEILQAVDQRIRRDESVSI